MLRRFLFSLSFLTIVPVRSAEIEKKEIPACAVFFPLVGWLLGLLLYLAGCGLLRLGFSSSVTAVLLVACAAWFTRGLHLDGVADLLDGLGGGFDARRRLQIMKDSAIGAFGVIGMLLVLLLKTTVLSDFFVLPAFEHCSLRAALLLAFVPAAARFSILLLAWKSDYPRASGTGHAFVGSVRGRHLLLSFCFLLPALFWQPASLVLLAATLMPSLVLQRVAARQLGGVTGDVLGANCEFAETVGWLILPLLA